MTDDTNTRPPVPLQEYSRALAKAEALLDVGGRATGYLGALTIGFLALLIITSTLSRYLFSRPFAATEEVGGMLFLAIVFLSLTYGLLKDRHVRLELLWARFASPWKQFLAAGGYILSIIALSVLVKVVWDLTLFSYERQTQSIMVQLLNWPWWLLMFFCLLLFTLALCVKSARTILDGMQLWLGGEQTPDDPAKSINLTKAE